MVASRCARILLIASLPLAHAGGARSAVHHRRSAERPSALLQEVGGEPLPQQPHVPLVLRGGQVAQSAGDAAPPAKRKPKKAAAAAEAEAPAPSGPVVRPNQLTIAAGEADQEGSVAVMHPSKMEQLGFLEGDIVRLKGKRDKEALCVVKASKAVGKDGLALAGVTRTNLMLSLGDSTKAYACDDVKQATKLLVAPFEDAMGGLSVDEIHEQLVVPYFCGAEGDEPPYRPVSEGELLRLRHGAQIVECKVLETEPPRRCIVGPDTEFELAEEALDRKEEEGDEELGYALSSLLSPNLPWWHTWHTWRMPCHATPRPAPLAVPLALG